MVTETSVNNIALESENMTQEYMVLYDFWLWTGRLFGFSFLILWSLNEWFIIVFMAALIMDAVYLNKLSSHLYRKEEDLPQKIRKQVGGDVYAKV